MIVNVGAYVNYAPHATIDNDNYTLTYYEEHPIKEDQNGKGTVYIGGCQSYDPNGDSLIYQWSLINAPREVTLSTSGCSATVAVDDLHGWLNGRKITIKLRVSDPEGLWDEDTAAITLKYIRKGDGRHPQ